ncbi:MAG: preprotein translocase subunit SecG [Patescibacteria group bacterium]|jgi:preprotein translocase subunit SecG|nr:preprotein translocase subunit SecG [Patescibacteria group bacterium]
MSTTIITIAQIIVSILLIGIIIIQQRGTGLGGIFGGGSTEFYQQRRGLEKKIFYFTIFLAALFFVLNLMALLRA